LCARSQPGSVGGCAAGLGWNRVDHHFGAGLPQAQADHAIEQHNIDRAREQDDRRAQSLGAEPQLCWRGAVEIGICLAFAELDQLSDFLWGEGLGHHVPPCVRSR
jgi:hypothetical protein